MTDQTYTFDLIQEGMVVASVTDSDEEQAFREIMHYACIYSQDGPVKVKAKLKRRKRRNVGEQSDGEK